MVLAAAITVFTRFIILTSIAIFSVVGLAFIAERYVFLANAYALVIDAAEWELFRAASSFPVNFIARREVTFVIFWKTSLP